MEPHYILPGLAAFGYALAAVFSKRALHAGFGVLRLSFIINMVFVPVFALVLIQHQGAIPWERIGLPVLTGLAFFLGQVFTFAAIRMGDVSLQTPIMGTKAVFVVVLAILIGTEVVTGRLLLAALASMLAVGLLGYSSGRASRVGLTVSLALLSSLFFAGSDTMMGSFGKDFGGPMFIFIAILTNGLLSIGLIPFFNDGLKLVPQGAWSWGLAAALLMALQALLMNYSLATYQNVASSNVIYSTRGLWSVFMAVLPFGIFAGTLEVSTTMQRWRRFAGALLMCVAIYILFSN